MSSKQLRTLEDKIENRVNRSTSQVFLRKDFSDLGGYDQVGRSLRQMVRRGELVRIGYGLYARARKSPLTNKPVPEMNIGRLAIQALQRLNVPVEPSSFERRYQQGLSEQVPTGRMLRVQGRISRKIGYDGKYISYERASG